MAFYDSVLNARLILEAAKDAGIDGGALLQSTGIPSAWLEDPFGRVPAAQQFALLEEAVRRTGDSAFGLRMARCWNRPGAMDAVGYRIAAVATFREMIEVGYESLRRLSNLQDVRLDECDGLSRIRYRPARTRWRSWPILLDFYMANVALQGRLLVDPDFVPVEATFARQEPEDVGPYEAVFRCALNFDHPGGALLFERRWLDAPTRSEDQELSRVMAAVLANNAPEPEPSDLLAARVRTALREMLRAGVPSLETVAGKLQMRPRTLQHQLRAEGLSYKELVEDARNELVLSLLRDSEATLDEIAWRAGYRSQGSLFRAFRRWTGQTPGEFRRAVGPARPPG